MARFRVQQYVLALQTFVIEADTASKAVASITDSTRSVDCEVLERAPGEDLVRVESPEDTNHPDWLRLFDEWPGGAVDTIPGLRTVANVDTGERWDRWDGYWPPNNVEGERPIGCRDGTTINVYLLRSVESAFRSYREALNTIERIEHTPTLRHTCAWSREYHKALRQRNESWRKLDTLVADVPEDKAIRD